MSTTPTFPHIGVRGAGTAQERYLSACGVCAEIVEDNTPVGVRMLLLHHDGSAHAGNAPAGEDTVFIVALDDPT